MSVFDGSIVVFAGIFGFITCWFQIANPSDANRQDLEEIQPEDFEITTGLNGRRYSKMSFQLRFGISLFTGLIGAVSFGYFLKWFPL